VSKGTNVWAMPELPAGSVRRVVRAPDPLLSMPGVDIDPTSAAAIELVADLLATQVVWPGCVGLAAQQIGVVARACSVDVSGHAKTRTCHGAFVLCNAQVLTATAPQRGREGCLSIPDFTGDVARGRRVVVSGQLPLTGQWVELSADGFEAVALQHEIDHTNGLLFLDRVRGPHGIHPRRSYL
jgi:peptide deformylase